MNKAARERECSLCYMPKSECECESPFERAQQHANEYMALRAVADAAITRGYAVCPKCDCSLSNCMCGRRPVTVPPKTSLVQRVKWRLAFRFRFGLLVRLRDAWRAFWYGGY